MEIKNQYGLVGKNTAHSFSQQYFTEKFDALKRNDCSYRNFDLADISQFPEIIKSNPNLKGLNVTIPYKESIIPFLDELSETAKKIGAVNTIQFSGGKLKGCNTDHYGFRKSLEPLLKTHHKKALILGTGGASKAVAFALDELGIPYEFVSRNPIKNRIGYNEMDSETFAQYQIIVNTTPIGTFPDVHDCPPIPYGYFTKNHIAFDLIYNPGKTLFLKNAKTHGAVIKNGFEMLELQAEKSWEIWNE